MLIAFEGPIAAGKTTLAQLYSSHARSPVLLEEFGSNEFLADFYADNDRWALAMQTSFLLDRCTQLSATDMRCPLTVADYAFLKNEVFAQVLFKSRELRLFSRLVDSLGSSMRNPDVFVHLDARNDVLLERIARRGRPYETHIDEGYLDRLRASYDLHLRPAAKRRILKFDTSTLDLESEKQVQDLFAFIDAVVRTV